MRSRLRACLVAVVISVCESLTLSAQQPTTVPYSREDIADAVAKVKSDPNIGGQRTVRMLRFRDRGPRQRGNVGWLAWVAGFFAWLTQSARYLMWVALALVAGWLGVYLLRALRQRSEDERGAAPFVPPTHVRDLDIRPESLPANIGAAARALWERGEHRAALSLLYRGLLSRLTHVHRVPIVDSSTEGDCLSLMSGHVPATTGDYATRLIDAWRAFVYGGSESASLTINELCDGFSAALDRRAPTAIEEARR